MYDSWNTRSTITYTTEGKSEVETEEDTPRLRGWFDVDVVKGKEGNEARVVHGLAEDNSRLP